MTGDERPSIKVRAALAHLEEAGLAAGGFAFEIFVSAGCAYAAAAGAVDHADLHQVGFVHFFDGVFFFAKGGGEGAYANGATAVFIDEGEHQVAIDFVEAVFVYAEHGQGFLGYGASDAAVIRRARHRLHEILARVMIRFLYLRNAYLCTHHASTQ
jgi:hypothetical protein